MVNKEAHVLYATIKTRFYAFITETLITGSFSIVVILAVVFISQ